MQKRDPTIVASGLNVGHDDGIPPYMCVTVQSIDLDRTRLLCRLMFNLASV